MRHQFLLASALAAVCALGLGNAASAQPQVTVAQGTVRGLETKGSNAFLGLPFAKPPVGDLRWREPMKPSTWTGVRDGTRFGANCYQAPAGRFGPYTLEFMTDSSPVSEDCLYLNVWAPTAGAKKLPVLVWIHGGGFGGGSGSIPIYDGSRLAAKGAVVVTINYRVGAFGFLAHPDLTAESSLKSSGNYGLLDMIAALQWVRDNASRFGGDPASVTVAGQSAGAMAINDLLVSPMARGLFARAIAQSGTAAGPTVLSLSEAEGVGKTFAAKVGAASVADMRKVSAQAVLAASGAGPPVPGAPPRLRLVPVVDGQVVTANPNDPQAVPSMRVPLLTGYNRDEGKGVTVGKTSTPEQFEQSVRARFGDYAERVLSLYPHANAAEATSAADTLPRDMVTATLSRWAEVRAAKSASPVYVYMFDHVYPGPEASAFGTFHTAEVPYLFGVLDQQNRPFTDADRRISDTLQAYWLNFMRTGNPNGRELTKWPHLGERPGHVMLLGDTFSVAPAGSSAERLKLLREIIAKQGYAAFI